MTRPIDGVDVVLADLDGVVYAGANAIPHAVESLNEVARSIRVGYVTNNASRTDESVAQHLRDLGLTVETRDVVTSPQAAMSLLHDAAPAGSTILVIGGEGLTSEVSKAGFVVTDSAEDAPAAVIQGFSPDLGWKHLAEASFALNKREPGASGGIPWIATNMDWTIPVARGVAPGNGTLVSAVHLAVGRLPIVAGKPELPIFDEAKRRFETDNLLFIGDRLDTDIKGAVSAGIRSVLVLTGIDSAKQALAAPAGSHPTYIVDDLRQLHVPYPETVTHADGSVSVGEAHVVKRGMEIVVVREGAHPLDAVRAACTLIWDSGLMIYGFDVPERLHGYRPAG
jgi:glycerol 3-phosphatase-2